MRISDWSSDVCSSDLKTTAVNAAGDAFGKPEITYDTNMNTLSSAVDKVEQALAAGRDVRIAYVYRDPVEALTGGAIPRAERQAVKFGSGRTVPLAEHAKTDRKSTRLNSSH